MPRPDYCRPAAFDLFRRQLPQIESTGSLLRAAVAISMHELDEASPEAVQEQIESLAALARARLQSNQVQAILAHLHEVLFEEVGFAGNDQDYYNPENSYLSRVLATRRGIPISLALIYKAVAEELNLHVLGVNCPGHFLARVVSEEGTMLVDPFFGGRAMTDEEAFRRIEQMSGRSVPHRAELLHGATHRQWLARMLANLHRVFAEQGRREDQAAMMELAALLTPAA